MPTRYAISDGAWLLSSESAIEECSTSRHVPTALTQGQQQGWTWSHSHSKRTTPKMVRIQQSRGKASAQMSLVLAGTGLASLTNAAVPVNPAVSYIAKKCGAKGCDHDGLDETACSRERTASGQEFLETTVR